MNILITGGAGFIGTVLAKQLISAGHEVVAVDPLTPQIHGALPELQLPEGLELIRADIRNSEQYRDAVEKADAIYHLAAETGTGQSMYQISQYVSCNDFGTAQLLETIASCTPRERTIFLASSRSIYGEGAYTRAGGDEAVMQAKPRSPEALAREVDEFFNTHLTPQLREQAHYSWDGHNPEIHKKLAEARLLFPAWSEALGGRGASPYAANAVAQVWERQGWGSHAANTTSLVGHMMHRFGSDTLKTEVLQKVIHGEAICSLGYSEPGSGSDVFAAQCRAI